MKSHRYSKVVPVYKPPPKPVKPLSPVNSSTTSSPIRNRSKVEEAGVNTQAAELVRISMRQLDSKIEVNQSQKAVHDKIKLELEKEMINIDKQIDMITSKLKLNETSLAEKEQQKVFLQRQLQKATTGAINLRDIQRKELLANIQVL